MDHPKITVVTPSHNQGQYLEETIISVIGQQYPNLEYIVMDGGSTDNSVEIIKKYEKHLAYWVSENDGGQSAAINKGFGMATGNIFAWLNSDDMYLPGVLSYVASKLDTRQPQLLFGNCLRFVENQTMAFGSDVSSEHEKRDLLLVDYIFQPSSFWTRDAWRKTGPLDESLIFGFDWEWFIRAQKAGIAFKPEAKYLSLYRIHEAHKTGVGGDKRLQELASIYGKHSGRRYERLFSRCCRYGAQIRSRRKWFRQLGLSKFEAPIFKATFPNLFRGFSQEEVGDIIAMI